MITSEIKDTFTYDVFILSSFQCPYNIALINHDLSVLVVGLSVAVAKSSSFDYRV